MLFRSSTGRFSDDTTKVFIDKQEMLPVRYEEYGYPTDPRQKTGPLIESCTYIDLHFNTGLTDIDFSSRNPLYNFSRF